MINFEDIDYKRFDDESEDDYALRICSLKEQKYLYILSASNQINVSGQMVFYLFAL